MAKKEDTEQEAPENKEPLTEEQRIAQLEKKAGTNKLVLFSMALVLVIVISMLVTAFTLLIFKDTKKSNNEADTGLQTEVLELKQQLGSLDSKLNDFSLTIPELKGQLANTQNTTLKRVMLEQEQSFQTFLTALQSGTYDLAHMVPGSRTWLEQYSEQISQAMTHSKDRINSLKSLNSSEALSKDDPFFGDDF